MPDGADDDEDAMRYVSVDASAISVFPKRVLFAMFMVFAVVGTTLLLERPMVEMR